MHEVRSIIVGIGLVAGDIKFMVIIRLAWLVRNVFDILAALISAHVVTKSALLYGVRVVEIALMVARVCNTDFHCVRALSLTIGLRVQAREDWCWEDVRYNQTSYSTSNQA